MDNNAKVQTAGINMLNLCLINADRSPRIPQSVAEEQGLVEAVVGLLENNLATLRSKALLSVTLLCRLDAAFLLKACSAKAVLSIERLMRDKEKCVRSALERFQEQAALVMASVTEKASRPLSSPPLLFLSPYTSLPCPVPLFLPPSPPLPVDLPPFPFPLFLLPFPSSPFLFFFHAPTVAFPFPSSLPVLFLVPLRVHPPPSYCLLFSQRYGAIVGILQVASELEKQVAGGKPVAAASSTLTQFPVVLHLLASPVFKSSDVPPAFIRSTRQLRGLHDRHALG